MSLIAHWCPRCKVQSDTRWHLCEPAAPLFPQTAKETQCEEIEVVPADQLRGAVKERDVYRRELERIADDDLGTWDKAMRHARATLDRFGGQ